MKLDVLTRATGEVTLWEEVPDEDLHQDSELTGADLLEEIYQRVLVEGDWKLVRRADEY